MALEEIAKFGRVLLVAAHPDDEVIGAGGQFPDLLDRLIIVHVTDGSPVDGADAQRAGFSSNADYAQRRFEESYRAAKLAGLTAEQFMQIRVQDQRASFDLRTLSMRVGAIFEEVRPDLVLTHSYEGGHPDHDATAFAVQAASTLVERTGVRAPRRWEFTSYFAGPEGMVAGRFLPGSEHEVVRTLSADRRELKRRMLACFTTQSATLQNFTVDDERFRPAPRYDFAQPPHAGKLHYDNYNWGITSEHFRALAKEASGQLELD
jgi:N-acetylglucosamine malate deacetylase 2